MLARIVSVAAIALGLIAVSAIAEENPHAVKHPSNAAFERMKGLAGAWEGKTSDGSPVAVTYSLVSGGTALMETLGHATEPMMVTMYHPDGAAALMLTHYCDSDNQPRMRAKVPEGKITSLSFDFVDCTNLASAGEGHMHHMVITFEDADHFTQEWTWKDTEGKDIFHYARKKA